MSINFSQKSSFLTSYLVKILKLACKLVPPLSAKFKLKRPVFQISTQTVLPLFGKIYKKRREIPFFAIKWLYLCPSNEDKRPILGQTRRNINKIFRTKEPPRNCRLKTTTFGTLLLSKYNYDGNDACRINTGFTANDVGFW